MQLILFKMKTKTVPAKVIKDRYCKFTKFYKIRDWMFKKLKNR